MWKCFARDRSETTVSEGLLCLKNDPWLWTIVQVSSNWGSPPVAAWATAALSAAYNQLIRSKKSWLLTWRPKKCRLSRPLQHIELALIKILLKHIFTRFINFVHLLDFFTSHIFWCCLVVVKSKNYWHLTFWVHHRVSSPLLLSIIELMTLSSCNFGLANY